MRLMSTFFVLSLSGCETTLTNSDESILRSQLWQKVDAQSCSTDQHCKLYGYEISPCGGFYQWISINKEDADLDQILKIRDELVATEKSNIDKAVSISVCNVASPDAESVCIDSKCSCTEDCSNVGH